MRLQINWRSVARNWRKLLLAGVVASVAVAAFCWGRNGAVSEATATPPDTRPKNETASSALPPSDASQRVVAYIYGTTQITREELGEYLIARYGTEKLKPYVNKRIIERACKAKGIEVTEAEITADLAETLKGMNVTYRDFVERILKQYYHKSFFEWREDVVRPKLLMAKLCRDRIKVSDEELQKCYESHYGEKVECRIIIWPRGEEKIANSKYAEIRKSDDEFDRAARSQADPTLAAAGGRTTPIGRYSTASEALEKAAFSLRPGELSELIGTAQGTMVVKCVQRIPPETSKRLEDVRTALEKEVFDKKLALEVPKVFAEMKDEAAPNLFLNKHTTEEDLVREVERELRSFNNKMNPKAPQKD